MVDLHENALFVLITHTRTHAHTPARAACGALEQKGGWHVLWASVTGSLATGTTGKHLWLNGGYRRELFSASAKERQAFRGSSPV